MAITHVQSVAGSTTATTSDTIVIPTVEAGDFLMLGCTNKGATAAPTVEDDDTGGNTWTRLDGTATNGASVWYKRATLDTSGKSVTASGFTTSCAVGLSVYRGLDSPDLPIENLSVQVLGSGVETVAGMTPTRDGSLICFFTMNRNVATSVGTPTATNPATLDERYDVVHSTAGELCAIEHASAVQTTAGPTGSISWTQTNSGHITITFDLMPPLVATEERRGVGARNWKALADAEFEIHKIGTTVPKDYEDKLDQAEDASEAPKSDEPPKWVQEFVEEEYDWRAHLAAVDLILERIDASLREVTEAWLKREIERQRDEEEAAYLLLLN